MSNKIITREDAESALKRLYPKMTIDSITELMLKYDRIRRKIYKAMPQMNENFVDSPNPYYGRLHTEGGIIIAGYYNSPSRILTPLGQWSVSHGGFVEHNNSEEVITKAGFDCVKLADGVQKRIGFVGGYTMITKDLESGEEFKDISSQFIDKDGEMEFIHYDSIGEFSYEDAKNVFNYIEQEHPYISMKLAEQENYLEGIKNGK